MVFREITAIPITFMKFYLTPFLLILFCLPTLLRAQRGPVTENYPTAVKIEGDQFKVLFSSSAKPFPLTAEVGDTVDFGTDRGNETLCIKATFSLGLLSKNTFKNSANGNGDYSSYQYAIPLSSLPEPDHKAIHSQTECYQNTPVYLIVLFSFPFSFQPLFLQLKVLRTAECFTFNLFFLNCHVRIDQWNQLIKSSDRIILLTFDLRILMPSHKEIV